MSDTTTGASSKHQESKYRKKQGNTEGPKKWIQKSERAPLDDSDKRKFVPKEKVQTPQTKYEQKKAANLDP